MTAEEIIEQLERLIDEREAFIRAYAPDRNVFVRDKEALEEAVKVLKQYNRMVQVKAKPVKQRIKIQYEGEELTIKELVGKLEHFKGSQEYLKWAVVEREKEIAFLKKQLADIQPVQHGRWLPEDEYYVDDTYICSVCGYEFIITAGDLESNELNYCPRCGAKMDGGKL